MHRKILEFDTLKVGRHEHPVDPSSLYWLSLGLHFPSQEEPFGASLYVLLGHGCLAPFRQ